MKKSPGNMGADKEPVKSEAPKAKIELEKSEHNLDFGKEYKLELVELKSEPKTPITIHKTIKRKRDALKFKEVNMPIFAHMPNRSKMARKQADEDFRMGKVQNPAMMLLPDGQIICAGGTVKTVMSTGIKAMARSGKLVIGKALKGAKVRGRA